MLNAEVTALTARRRVRPRKPPAYRAERVVVALMFDMMGRLLAAASQSDPVVRRELRGFPEGYTIGFAVLGERATMRLCVREGRFVTLDKNAPRPALEVTFKHVTHAYNVLTFQESTARAFANERVITNGDTALAMRLVRCLNRVEALTLPPFVASRALKQPLPRLTLRERAIGAGRLYAQLLRQLVRRNAS